MTRQPVGWITPTGQLFPLSSYRPEQKLPYDAHKAGWRHVVVADEPVSTPSPTAHAAAAAFADGLPELAQENAR